MSKIYVALAVLSVPVDGKPSAPAGAQDAVNKLWGSGLWWFAVVCAIALLAVLGYWAFAQFTDRGTGGLGKAVGVLMIACAASGVPAAIGAVTGT